MMKKPFLNFRIFLLVSLFGFFALTSCSSDDNDDDSPPGEIDYSGLVLNEICGLDDPDDDWVEILNTTDKAIDISGVQIIKIDETGETKSIYTVPDGTSIAANGYKVAATLSGELTAGISNTKQIGLDLVKPDGTTSINKFSRDTDIGEGLGHASGGSYARLPNGTGNWSIVKTNTRGTANQADEQLPEEDYTGLILNEICGGEKNSDDDWVEIYNSSEDDIDISGVQIVKIDEDGAVATIYTFPADTKIGAGSYRVVAKETDELSAKISNSKQVGIKLTTPNDEVIDAFDRGEDIGEDTGHLLGGSYARLPNVTGDWDISYTATRGMENEKGEAPVVYDYTGLVLNEVNGNGTKFIELYNNSDAAIDISSVIIKKNGSTLHTIPANTIIPSKTIMTFVSGTDFSGGISAKRSLLITLVTPDEQEEIDVFKNLKEDGTEEWDVAPPKYNGETTTQSYGRFPDGAETWQMMTATQDAANTEGTTAITW